jgi:putative hemolysin
VIEEIVGEIEDEFDPAVKADFVKEGENFKVAGDFPLHTLRERLELDGLNGADVDTVSGYVIQKLGRWPRPGDTVDLGDYRVRVTAVQQKRVAQVLITPRTQEAARQDGPGKA